ncbi:MAG: PGPGW domain-containing protein [Nocardioidaceae bacterium]|nr:PGPGW domain-containing protein [Nocardioidaceae bacterium]
MPRLRKTWVTLLGWLLTLTGFAALVLPGPGLLIMLAGLIVLSQEYDWAERRVEPLKKKAFEAAATGVETWPRIVLSACSALGLVAMGVVWWWEPVIPEFWIVGPQLPFAGWPTGSSLIVSGVVAAALLVYSVRRFRASPRTDRADA